MVLQNVRHSLSVMLFVLLLLGCEKNENNSSNSVATNQTNGDKNQGDLSKPKSASKIEKINIDDGIVFTLSDYNAVLKNIGDDFSEECFENKNERIEIEKHVTLGLLSIHFSKYKISTYAASFYWAMKKNLTDTSIGKMENVQIIKMPNVSEGIESTIETDGKWCTYCVGRIGQWVLNVNTDNETNIQGNHNTINNLQPFVHQVFEITLQAISKVYTAPEDFLSAEKIDAYAKGYVLGFRWKQAVTKGKINLADVIANEYENKYFEYYQSGKRGLSSEF